jgi:hypothetical protein
MNVHVSTIPDTVIFWLIGALLYIVVATLNIVKEDPKES